MQHSIALKITSVTKFRLKSLCRFSCW